jgi:hypothetical protein
LILIVSGLPRSGTSLAMQMLAAGGLPAFTDGFRVPDASNPRGYLEESRVRGLARDASWVSEADGRALKVVAPLLRHLPPGPTYRVVFVTRDIEEVLASQATMLAQAGQSAGRAETLRPVFERQLAEARDWARLNAEAVTDLPHALVIGAPAEAAARLADFAGGELDRDAMAAVVDPTLYRQRGARRDP